MKIDFNTQISTHWKITSKYFDKHTYILKDTNLN